MGPINELTDPTFNGSGLLNVIISASGAEYRLREIAAKASGLLPDNLPELIDYSLILKNQDGSELSVREFNSLWHAANTETYIGMPERYRLMFGELNNMLPVFSTETIPLNNAFFVPVSGHNVNNFPHLASNFNITIVDKNTWGGINLISNSGYDYNFTGGNQPVDGAPHTSTYNYMALPELILAFNNLPQSGYVSLANPNLNDAFPPSNDDISHNSWMMMARDWYSYNATAIISSIVTVGGDFRFVRKSDLSVMMWIPFQTNEDNSSVSVAISGIINFTPLSIISNPPSHISDIPLSLILSFKTGVANIFLVSAQTANVTNIYEDFDIDSGGLTMFNQPNSFSVNYSNNLNVPDKGVYYIIVFFIGTLDIDIFYDGSITFESTEERDAYMEILRDQVLDISYGDIIPAYMKILRHVDVEANINGNISNFAGFIGDQDDITAPHVITAYR